MSQIKVLFICTGNTTRGVMAQAFLKKYGGDEFFVSSAGIEPGEPDAMTIEVMKEAKIDVSKLQPKNIEDFVGNKSYNYIITLSGTAESKAPIFPGMAYRLSWPFENPKENSLSEEEMLLKYRSTRDQIEEKIKNWVEEIREKIS